MSVSFNQIPLDIRTPGAFIEFDSSRAVSGPGAQPHKALLIVPKLAAGTLAAETPARVMSAADGDLKLGRGSIGAQMVRAFLAANPYTELYVIAVADDAGGTAATKTITVTASGAKAGTIFLYVAGERLEVPVAEAAAQNTIAAAILAAVNARTDLPYTAAAPANVVTLTSRHKGTLGNAVDVKVNHLPGEELPSGVTVVIAADAVGATDTSLANAVAAMAAEQYNTIASAWSATTPVGLIETELALRWGPMVQTDGHLFIAVNDTIANLTTAGNARNSPHSTLLGLGKSPTPPWRIAAAVAGLDAYECQIDPARPRQTLEVPAVYAPAKADQQTRAERNVLLTDGVSTFTISPDGKVLVERLITTYQTNAQGVADVAYLSLEPKRTLSYLRWSQRARITSKFPRHKLADDGALFDPGQAIVTPRTIRAELLALYMDWERLGYVEGWKQYADELIVERNASDRDRIDVRQGPNLVNAFRVFAGQIQFIL